MAMNGMKPWTRAGLVALLGLLLAACGGGGGGGDSSESTSGPRAVLPTLAQDTEAPGPTTDVRALNYYGVPDEPGTGSGSDRWDYDVTIAGVPAGTAVRRVAASSVPGYLEVTEEDLRTGARASQRYQRTDAGLVSWSPLADAVGGVSPAITTSVESWLELPERLPAFGSTRGLLRQGSVGLDLDGDGFLDSFRLELRQTVVGMDTLTLRNTSQAEALHLRLVLTLEVVPSDRKQSVYRVDATEDQWWVAGVGLVRSSTKSVDSEGVVLDTHELELTGGVLNNRPLLAPLPDGSLRVVSLPHNALVYDPTRNVYYASVPGSVTGRGNTLARIDAVTGDVVHSGNIGSEPNALALAADGSVLYVGLDGSGEVARVRLPDMVVEATVRPPNSGIYNAVRRVRMMAVSPVEPSFVALLVGDDYDNSPLMLWRNGTLSAPTSISGWSWQANRLEFSADGASLFQAGTMLTRSRVVGNDLVEELTSFAPQSYVARMLRMPQGLVTGNEVYATTDLARLATIPSGSRCAPSQATGRVLCMGDVNGDAAVLVVDANTWAVVAQPRWRRQGDGMDTSAWELVPGPAGQVALRTSLYGYTPATSITLFTSQALQ